MLLSLSLGKWITPRVTGKRPLPCYAFTLLSLSRNRVIMHGGINPGTDYSDVIYISTITGYELVSIIIVVNIILALEAWHIRLQSNPVNRDQGLLSHTYDSLLPS